MEGRKVWSNLNFQCSRFKLKKKFPPLKFQIKVRKSTQKISQLIQRNHGLFFDEIYKTIIQIKINTKIESPRLPRLDKEKCQKISTRIKKIPIVW
jgi:hypothetical protein